MSGGYTYRAGVSPRLRDDAGVNTNTGPGLLVGSRPPQRHMRTRLKSLAAIPSAASASRDRRVRGGLATFDRSGHRVGVTGTGVIQQSGL
jgi:hypothetical protein